MPHNPMDLLMYLGGLADATIYLIKDMEYQDSEKLKFSFSNANIETFLEIFKHSSFSSFLADIKI